MNIPLFLITGSVAAIGLVMFINHIYSVIENHKLKVLNNQATTDNTKLVVLQQQEPNLKQEAIQEQTNATEEQKKTFWEAQLDKNNN